MTEILPTYLKRRAHKAYLGFVRDIEAIPQEQALRYALPNWPDHRWGIGQNGSIAGIVYHVAAWKQMTLPLLTSVGTEDKLPVISREEFDTHSFPVWDDWPNLIAWYRQIGEEWVRCVDALSSEDFDTTYDWEGNVITVSTLVAEIVEHDIQHASQIEYLQQRLMIDTQ